MALSQRYLKCRAKLKRKRKEPNVFIAEYAGGLARQNIRPFQAA
jgi:site-specific recombinase XerD